MNLGYREVLLAGMGVAAAGACYAYFIERSCVRLDRFTVETDKPGLPPEGVTILHLSDLHCRAAEWVQARKLARLQRLLVDEDYDIVALTGDLIHDMAGLPTALAFLRTLHPRLRAFSVPGNRDYWVSGFRALLGRADERAGQPLWAQFKSGTMRLRGYCGRVAQNQPSLLHLRPNDIAAVHAALAGLGVMPLVNRACYVQASGVDLWVAGLDDLHHGQPDLDAALADAPEGALLVLLAHNPDAWLGPRASRADLTLAGHTHGGQFRLPWLGALYRQGTHLSRRRAAGWFQRGEARLFVSRGLGESFPLRFGAPLQAALIRLVPRIGQSGSENHSDNSTLALA